MKINKWLLKVTASSFVALFVWAMPTQAQTNDPSKPLPPDPEVITGKLENGFTYYIRKNTMPEKRAVLYLANKVGSILETEEQLGLAHFAEHMAFKGTKNFPKNELISYLQRAGVKFGADLNAYTGFEETVYQLPIPSDDIALLETGVQILRDWAQDILMETEEIDSERGVIYAEMQQRKGIQQRVQEKTLPILLNNARHVQRLPIGDPKIFMNFQPDVMRKFYKDWYRPDLQAIIAVGDFDVAVMEKWIKDKFSDLKMPEQAPERLQYPVELEGKNNYLTYVDDEITATTLQIIYKSKSAPERTEAGLLRGLANGIFNNLISIRISDLRKQGDPPFVSASAQIGSIFDGVGSATLTVTAKPGETERGVKALFEELKRVKDFGFTQTELDRAKTSFLEGRESQYRERDKTTSQSYADRYLQVFLKDNAYPSAEFSYNFYKENTDKITLEDINVLIDRFYKEENRDIFVLAATKEEANLPSEGQLLAWAQDVQNTTLTAYEEADLAGDLIPVLPAPGKIVNEQSDAEMGTTTLTLDNGIKVVLKPTDFRNDQIIISSFSPGGTSLYGYDDYQSAINAAGIVGQSGLGDFDSKSLPKKLTGKMVRVSPYISDYFEGINAQTSKKDFETGLQLIYQHFYAPRLDADLIEGILKNSRENVRNRYQSPGNVFSDTVNNILNNYHWRKSPPTLEKIDMIDSERAFEIYKERFADASDFTFVMTGSFDIDSVKPLIEQYIGSLPSLNRNEKSKDIGIKTHKGAVQRTIYKGAEERATVQLLLTGAYKPSLQTNVYISALQEVLRYRLFERLRNVESGVYSPSVSIGRSRIPSPQYTVSISFTCEPDNVANLIAATKDEVAKIAKEGIKDDEITKIIAEYTRSIEVSSKTNEYWHNSISSNLQLNEDPRNILRTQELIEDIQPKKLKSTAKKYLKVKNFKEFVLLPEAK